MTVNGCIAQHHAQRKELAQCLGDACMQRFHLSQDLHGKLVPMLCNDLPLLLYACIPCLPAGHQEDASPRGGDGGLMHASKQCRNKQSGDLALCQRPAAIGSLIAAIDEGLQNVVALDARLPSLADDVLKDGTNLLMGFVSLAVKLNG